MNIKDVIESIQKLIILAPYLATLAIVAWIVTFLIIKFRKEITEFKQEVKKKLANKIDETRAVDLIKTIVTPVIMALNAIQTLSTNNAQSLKELNQEVSQLSKYAFGAETNIKNLEHQIEQLHEKVYD